MIKSTEMRSHHYILLFPLLLLLTLGGCGKAAPKETAINKNSYTIGIDPSFFPLQMTEERGDLLGFINDLLQEMGKKKGVQFVRMAMSWDNLLEGLQRQKYQGAFSAAPPNVINQTKYSFSDPLFFTGPVLITRTSMAQSGFADLKGKVVGMEKTDTNLELLATYPEIIPEFYDSIAVALENTMLGKYAACLVPVLEGAAYVKDLYRNELAIASPVLSNEGMRLLTLLHQNSSLLTFFNEGLQMLKTSGKFAELLTKWNIPKEAVNSIK